MADTRIEWAQKVWNPVTGCTKISSGCQNCYAERMAKRLRGRCGYPAEDPFRVTLHPERLEEPLRWRKPSKIFVCSMGDLFHEAVPDDFIARVWHTMAINQEHVFQILTKRPDRMAKWIDRVGDYQGYKTHNGEPHKADGGSGIVVGFRKWPLPNVWLGVTVENQEQADKRIPILLQIPAAVRFVSVEPMLGPVDLTRVGGDWHGYGRIDALNGRRNIEEYIFEYSLRWKTERCEKIDWVVCGGETGPNARPMHPDWVRSLRDQCQSAGVPFFFKSWGEWVCRPWSSDNGRKRELCLGMDGTSVYTQVGHMMGFRKPGEALMVRVGKKAAGRFLDGREWNELPGRPVGGCHGES